MSETQVKFDTINRKRKILVADDELINRELLGMMLEEDFDVLYACDGEEAIEKIRENADTLSLVLLDLMMPKVHGIEVLTWINQEPGISHIPVIVLTADQKTEVECLKKGAMDFLPKPYPQREIILARVQRAIELTEDRDLIMSTERDSVTGLFNREYFYRYAEQFDTYHKDDEMDAMIVDINHFHIINERYGRQYGNEILKQIGAGIEDTVREKGGMVCRREADTFLIYCPHGTDYQGLLDRSTSGLKAGGTLSENRVRLRMGVYPKADKGIDIERRFDRAKMAADTIRGSFTKTVAIYDDNIHEREMYTEQLLEDFPKAIRERQFVVYFQPKFNVLPDIPVLASAEALIRWQHPGFGMISPGVFIPLFEENGLIQRLDRYVWRETAAKIKQWKEKFGIVVPVSVNVSRIDMYDPELEETLTGILHEFGLRTSDLLLEITESAYTQDSQQIIARVERLRKLGFKIEMDDFGTGYSSLSMISSLPIDALKLDMMFVRNAFKEGRDIRMLELIIDIADYLGVPVIAEGVETEDQLKALRAMGCDIIQGYYFSRPVPADEYERFLIEKKAMGEQKEAVKKTAGFAPLSAGKPAYVERTAGFSDRMERIYYVNTADGSFIEFTHKGSLDDLEIERRGEDFFGSLEEICGGAGEEDRKRILTLMQKDVILSQVACGQCFSLNYRMAGSEGAAIYNLKAIKTVSSGADCLVIGVSNIGGTDEKGRAEDAGSFQKLADAVSGRCR